MSGKPISDLMLERMALGEIPAPDPSADPELTRLLAALRASNEEILKALPPDQVLAEIERRRARAGRVASARPTSPVRRRKWSLALAAAGVAAAVLVTMRTPATSPDPAQIPAAARTLATRTKGLRPQLRVYLAPPSPAGGPAPRAEAPAPPSPMPAASGDRAASGDVVQLAYVSADQPFGAIVSVDGRCTITWHLPRDGAGDTAVALQASGEVPLPDAYALDDAPSFERFFLITGRTPFALAPINAALAGACPGAGTAAAPALPGLEAASILLEKR